MKQIKFRNNFISRRLYSFNGCPCCGGCINGKLGGIFRDRTKTIYQGYRATCQDCAAYFSEIYVINLLTTNKVIVSVAFPLLFDKEENVIASWRFGCPLQYVDLLETKINKLQEDAARELASQKLLP